MNMENIGSDVAKELLLLLSYCDSSFIENIPNDVLIRLNYLAADSLKEFYVDKNKSLIEQDISNECKELLSYMYYEYMGDISLQKEISNLSLKVEDDFIN